MVWDVNIMENGWSRGIFMGTGWRLGQFTVALPSLVDKEATTRTTFDNKRTLNQQAVLHVLLLYISEPAYAITHAPGLGVLPEPLQTSSY